MNAKPTLTFSREPSAKPTAPDARAALLANPVVDTAQVTIAKPDVLPACRSVGIEIERRRV